MPNDVINTITIGGTTYDIGGSGGGSGRAINATLLANSWDTNKRQALQFIGYNVNQNGVIGMPTSVTSTQKTAYQDADIRIYSQSSDTFTFECGATVPTIDLPVTLFITDASSAEAFVYKPAGSKTVAELISSLLVEANLGNVYNMTDSGTTTADFVEGAGKPIYAGDDIGIIDNGTSGSPSYKFNKLGGFIDLSNYIQKSLTAGLVKNDGSIDETEYQPAEEGKGLSTNDYTTAEKNKVGKIDETTTSISGNPISISGLKSNQLAVNPIITFEPIQAGSGTPSPVNERPISGYDKVEALSCGKNIIQGMITGYNIGSNGVISADTDYSLCYARVKVNQKYTISDGASQSVYAFYLEKPKANATSYNGSRSVITNHTFTSPINGYVAFRITINYGTAQLEEGEAATTYEAPNKTTDLSESLGQTVYYAINDVRTGKTPNKGKMIDLGNLSWQYWQNNTFYANTGISDYAWKSDVKAWCEIYEFTGTTTGISSLTGNAECKLYYAAGQPQRILYVRDTRYTDAAALKTALTGVKFCYEVNEPTEIQLTPHEISLLKDYAYVSTNGTNISLDYHNGEMASLADVSQLGETVNELPYGLLKSKTYTLTTNSDGRATLGIIDDMIPMMAYTGNGMYVVLRNASNAPTYHYAQLFDDGMTSGANVTTTITVYGIKL